MKINFIATDELFIARLRKTKFFTKWNLIVRIVVTLGGGFLWFALGFICFNLLTVTDFILENPYTRAFGWVITFVYTSLGLFTSFVLSKGILEFLLRKNSNSIIGDDAAAKIEVDITEENLAFTDAGGSQIYNWTQIENIEITDEEIYFFSEDQNVTAVPYGAFVSTEEKQEFIRLSKEYYRQSRN